VYDKFLKVIDVCANRFSTKALSEIVKLSLVDNNTIVAFDARMNPGSTDKIMHQIALCLVKNLEKAKKTGIDINKDFIKPKLYSKVYKNFESTFIPLLNSFGLKHES